ncbi:hypothetical protein A3K72_03745 [Candidatus Woesearchaeota archaeon RBG_13_36_6]|nr:MAG: hypothetical protein A3K72_03745 [Candidatus Woesearchaeota archaeon RBG_13_36_6]
MAKFKIEHHKEDCIGCGACAATCNSWEMGEDYKSHLKGSKKQGKIEVLETNDLGCNQDAADMCPVGCIKIKKL